MVINPDPKNVKNLQEASRPTSKAELCSFLGMAGFSERFIPNFATIVQLLRQQMKQTSWGWEEASEEAFIKLKESLSEHSLLHHYVIGRDTELVVVDASLTGFDDGTLPTSNVQVTLIERGGNSVLTNRT